MDSQQELFMKTISTSSVLLAVVVAIVAFNAIAEATYPCAVTINNHTWNFSPLTSTKDIRGTDSEDNAYEYTMNLCGTVNTEPYCKDKRAMVCRAETQGMGEWIMASFESLPEPTWSLIDKDNMDGGLHLTLKNGETCRTQDGVYLSPTFTISLICAKKDQTTFTAKFDKSTCTGGLTYQTRYACLDVPSDDDGAQDKKSNINYAVNIALGVTLLVVFGLAFCCARRCGSRTSHASQHQGVSGGAGGALDGDLPMSVNTSHSDDAYRQI